MAMNNAHKRKTKIRAAKFRLWETAPHVSIGAEIGVTLSACLQQCLLE